VQAGRFSSVEVDPSAYLNTRGEVCLRDGSLESPAFIDIQDWKDSGRMIQAKNFASNPLAGRFGRNCSGIAVEIAKAPLHAGVADEPGVRREKSGETVIGALAKSTVDKEIREHQRHSPTKAQVVQIHERDGPAIRLNFGGNMSLPVEDWMSKLEEMLLSLTTQWRSAKTTVIEESAVLSERVDRVEKKLDDVLAELRSMKKG